VCCIVLVGLIMLALPLALSWQNLALIPLVIVPPGAIIYTVYVRWLRLHGGDQDDSFIFFFTIGFFGAAICMFVEMAFTLVFGLICFNGKVVQELTQGLGKGKLLDGQASSAVEHDFGFYAFIVLTRWALLHACTFWSYLLDAPAAS